MATQKVVSIQDTDGNDYHLTASVLREAADNKNNDIQSVTKAQLRKVFAAHSSVDVDVTYRLAGGELYAENPIQYGSIIDVNKRLNVGCKTFDAVTTRKIRRWATQAKKAA
jgi:hypothetical protein